MTLIYYQTSLLHGHAGGFAEETLWSYRKLNQFKISRPGKKPIFQYSLPLVGQICRPCWILCAGWLFFTNVIEIFAYVAILAQTLSRFLPVSSIIIVLAHIYSPSLCIVRRLVIYIFRICTIAIEYVASIITIVATAIAVLEILCSLVCTHIHSVLCAKKERILPLLC